jgi:hypothetical protein
MEAADKADRLALEEKKLAIDAAYKADKMQEDQQREGVRMGIDIAKAHHNARQTKK